MLKKIKENILMGYFDENGQYHCTNTKVVDRVETDKAIKACEDAWQAEVDECTAQIEKYQQLKEEIGKKRDEASALQSEFHNNGTILKGANVNHPDTNLSGCETCLEDLMTAYDEMSAQCDSEVSDWGDKKAAAEAKKGSCPADTPVVYKWECL